MKTFLTEEEKLDLKIRHKTERDKLTADRIKAILLYDKGWEIEDIAPALFTSTDSITKYIATYQLERKI